MIAQRDYSLPFDSNVSCVQVLPLGPFCSVERSVKPVPAHPLMMTATTAVMKSRMACLADVLPNPRVVPIVREDGRKMEECGQ